MSKIVKIVTKDQKEIEVFKDSIEVSKLIKSIFEEEENEEENEEEDEQKVIPLDLNEDTFKKVIEFCDHYKNDPFSEIEKPLKSSSLTGAVPKWYEDFILGISAEDPYKKKLAELICAANYLDISPLLELCSACYASMIKGKTPEEIKKTFNIPEDEDIEGDLEEDLEDSKEDSKDNKNS